MFDTAEIRADWRIAPALARWLIVLVVVRTVATEGVGLVATIATHQRHGWAVTAGGQLTGLVFTVVWLALMRMLLARRRLAWTATFWLSLVAILGGALELLLTQRLVGGAIALGTGVVVVVLLKTRTVGAWILSRTDTIATPTTRPPRSSPAPSRVPGTVATASRTERMLRRIAGKNYPL